MFSPDGRQIAFHADRGRSERHDLYVINIDGTNLRRLTTHPDSDTTPTWSPSGTQIAFTSDRTGRAADLHHERRRHRRLRAAADSGRRSRPRNLGAGAVQRDRVHARATAPATTSRFMNWRRARRGSLRSAKERTRARRIRRAGGISRSRRRAPAWSQIFTIGRDGNGLRQITRTGNNQTPDWSN